MKLRAVHIYQPIVKEDGFQVILHVILVILGHYVKVVIYTANSMKFVTLIQKNIFVHLVLIPKILV
jgi:hypothetical protein